MSEVYLQTYLVRSEFKSLIHLSQTARLETPSSQSAPSLQQLLWDDEEGCGKSRPKTRSHRGQQPLLASHRKHQILPWALLVVPPRDHWGRIPPGSLAHHGAGHRDGRREKWRRHLRHRFRVRPSLRTGEAIYTFQIGELYNTWIISQYTCY